MIASNQGVGPSRLTHQMPDKVIRAWDDRNTTLPGVDPPLRYQAAIYKLAGIRQSLFLFLAVILIEAEYLVITHGPSLDERNGA